MKMRDPKGGEMWEWPEDLRVREFPEVYVCGPGEIGPQCGHVSFLAAMEYGPKGVPMHVHRNADGTWQRRCDPKARTRDE